MIVEAGTRIWMHTCISLSEHVMTPEEFAEKMREYSNQDEYGPSTGHQLADEDMCDVLTALGYGDGVAIFKAMEKWYD